MAYPILNRDQVDETQIQEACRLFNAKSVLDITAYINPDIIKDVREEVDRLTASHSLRRDLFIKTTGNTPRRMNNVDYDTIAAESSLLMDIYSNPDLIRLLAQIAGDDVHPCPYDFEKMVITSLQKKGDSHGWHWDDYSFAMIWVLRAAAEGRQYAGNALSTGVIRNFLAEIPEDEKTELLIRLVDGEPHVAAELKARLRTQECCIAHTEPRTVSELTARATAIRKARERADAARHVAERRRLAEEAEKARRKHLDDLRRKGEGIWLKVEAEINRRSASSYGRAANLLFDLQTIAEEQQTLADFIHHVEDIRERHARKGRFIERLTGLRTR